MTQQLLIEGDLVKIIETTVTHTARLTDIMPFIESRPPVTLMHPRSAIFTKWDESNGPNNMSVQFLCELPPSRRNIVKERRRYELAMPWTYFIFDFSGSMQAWSLDDSRVFHTNAKVESLDSRLWTAFLPNVYEDGRICFGSTGAPTRANISARVDQLLNEWYLTNFNNDLISGRTRPFPFAPTPKSSLRPWVDATATLGAGAWTTFPEWTDPAVGSMRVGELLQHGDRMAPMVFEEQIPPLPAPATFGRVEEWFTSLTPSQRLRVQRATQLNEVTPDDGAPAEDLNIFGPDDDGGVPV